MPTHDETIARRRRVNDEAVAQLATAIRAGLDACDDTGANLPEMLSAALETVARERGGSAALIHHRPGSWEATHVQALAADADW